MRLHDYLARVGVSGPLAPTLDTLRRLHIAHREAFLFENVSIQTGGRISVGLADIERKFLDEGRGGYCFEHNTLFAAALRDVGYEPTAFLGRVRRGPPERWCRTHMVLRVPVDGGAWLCDVGFGGVGLLEPIPLQDGAGAEQVGLTYGLRREGPLWVLACSPDVWSPASNLSDTSDTLAAAPVDLYEFSDDAQTPGDVEVANHYTSTHPDSMFRRSITIQRTTRAERIILRHDTFRRYGDGRIEDRAIDSKGLRTLAREVFGVTLPDGPLVYERPSDV
jgi:N-hydroxyarylamine O-acetyltransferase